MIRIEENDFPIGTVSRNPGNPGRPNGRYDLDDCEQPTHYRIIRHAGNSYLTVEVGAESGFFVRKVREWFTIAYSESITDARIALQAYQSKEAEPDELTIETGEL